MENITTVTYNEMEADGRLSTTATSAMEGSTIIPPKDATQFYYADEFYYDVMMDNISFFLLSEDMERIAGIQKNIATYGIVLSIWTLFINVFVIYLCMRDKEIRRQPFYKQVTNYSVSNILLSILVIPLAVYYDLQEWRLGDVVCKAWIILDVMIPFVSILILVCLNLDRLIMLFCVKTYFFRAFVSQFLVASPWILGVLIVVPLWTDGAVPSVQYAGECIVAIQTGSAVASPILVFFVPLFFTIALIMAILIGKLTYRDSSLHIKLESCSEDITSDTLPDDISCNKKPLTVPRDLAASTDTIVSLCLVTFTFSAMWLPFQVISVLLPLCNSYKCIPSVTLSQTLTWMATSSAGFTPLFWFIDLKIRTNLKGIFCSWAREEEDDDSLSEETFV